MQRCLILLLFLISSAPGWAQPVDVLRTEVSYWLENLSVDSIKARASITFRNTGAGTYTLDYLQSAPVYLRKKEGRLKEHIPYQLENGKLIMNLPENTTAREITVEMEYQLYFPDQQFHLRRGNDFLVMNPANLGSKSKNGLSGMFYPSVAGDEVELQINVSQPKGFSSLAPGTKEFIVQDDEMEAHFWSSTNALSSEAFFLLVGKFDADDPKNIVEQYGLTAETMAEYEAQLIRAKFQEDIEFYRKYRNTELVDQELVNLVESDSNIPSTLKEWLELNDLDSETNKPALNLALLSFDRDTARALLAFFRSRQKSDAMAFKEDAWNNAPLNQMQLLMWATENDSLLIESYLKSNNGISSLLQDTCKIAFVNKMQKAVIKPNIEIDYRYRNGMQNIYLRQDTAVEEPVHLSGKMTLHTVNGVLEFPFCSEGKAIDTISQTVSGSPRYVEVEFGSYFPAEVVDNRPEMYDLYQLTNADTEIERVEALRRLFNSTNKNLFSTALGIAMDDKNWEIRLEALKKAGDLNVPAQHKLKRAILQLAASDPHPQVKELAMNLSTKYYNNK